MVTRRGKYNTAFTDSDILILHSDELRLSERNHNATTERETTNFSGFAIWGE
jgi:hypothetical protein